VRRGALVPLALWLAAAAISGFTLRRHLEPFDEGLLLQAATRMADGQWPYADFGWSYGPGHPLLVAALFDAFGPSVLTWRIVRVAADATVAVVVWSLVRREPAAPWAPAAWLAAAVTVAQPVSANPFPVALAPALGAVAAAASGAAPSARRAAAAGALGALVLFWRVDLGVVTILAAVATLVARGARAEAAIAAAAGTGLGLLLYAPFAGAAGLSRAWQSLVVEAARDGAAWRLPFPIGYDGPLRAWPPGALAEDLKDVLGFYLPTGAVVGAVAVTVALVLRVRRGQGVPPAAAGVGVLAAGALVYLRSRPDEQHAQPLLAILCALLPIAFAVGRAPAPARARRGMPRALAALLAGCLALVLVAGAANRLSALMLPPDLEPVRLAGVPGVGVAPEEARALPGMVAQVQRLVPPGEPIYVAPRRSDLVTSTAPLVHFLVRRPNVLRRDALLQARPATQAAIVAALRRARPRAVVRWTAPASARHESNARGRPSGSRALDEYLASRYRLQARFGDYDVLVPRGP
jgi:hypothetical protein